MVKRVVAPILAAFILSGCQTYNAFDMFKKDDSYEKALMETKNAQIINSLETKAKISATYLNPLYPAEYKDGEYFFVGVYIPNDYDSPKNAGLFNKEYRLATKGGIEAKIVQEILKKEQNELYRKMPHTDVWSRYYVVSFPKQSGDAALELTLKSPYGEASLAFPRVH